MPFLHEVQLQKATEHVPPDPDLGVRRHAGRVRYAFVRVFECVALGSVKGDSCDEKISIKNCSVERQVLYLRLLFTNTDWR